MQRYRCRACVSTFREHPKPNGYTDEEKQRILSAYRERSSLRGLTRIFGVSRTTVSTWLKEEAEALSPLEETVALSRGACESVALQDQNRAYGLFWRNRPGRQDLMAHQWHAGLVRGAEHLSESAVEKKARSLIGRFTVQNGKVRAIAPISGEIDTLKAWNGLLFETGSADCCLEEKMESAGRLRERV